MTSGRRTVTTTVAIAVLCFVAGAYSVSRISGWLKSGLDATSTDAKAQGSDAAAVRIAAPSGVPSMELNDKQLASVKVVSVGDYLFPVEKSAVGSIDFNEEMTVQVFTPYQGKMDEGATISSCRRIAGLVGRRARIDSAQTFTDKYTISDGNETIELYHVDGLNHSDNMLIAYLPKEKIAINADLYSPPPAGGNLQNVNASGVALFRNIKRLKLDVAQHVPIHGNPGGTPTSSGSSDPWRRGRLRRVAAAEGDRGSPIGQLTSGRSATALCPDSDPRR